MPTYLLVHGAWHSGQAWARVVPPLGMAGHQVFTPSLTGYGERAHLLGPDVGLDTHVDDIVRLITEEDLQEVILVGHSYAGLVISGAANRVRTGSRTWSTWTRWSRKTARPRSTCCPSPSS
ncbi:MAG TPA: alpha/beta fold hydrolase [Streptosporangiaceae bacterium]|jgi:pimeloyl-ACP methyl ester carboxylesterase